MKKSLDSWPGRWVMFVSLCLVVNYNGTDSYLCEDAVRRTIPVGIEGTQATDKDRHLRSRESEHLCFVDQHPLGTDTRSRMTCRVLLALETSLAHTLAA